jgi:hypothetical protein
MKAITLDPATMSQPIDLSRIVVTQDATVGGVRWRKGQRLSAADAAVLEGLDRPVHAVVLAGDDVHEDEAGGRLAAAVTGPGLRVSVPKFSRYNLYATTKGLTRIDADRLDAINRVPGMAVFTLMNRLPVVPETMVAGVKVTPVAVPAASLREAEAIAAGEPIVQVTPFLPLRVGIINTERPEWKVREKFEESVRHKIGWFGGSVLGFRNVAAEPEAIAREIESFATQGAGLVLAAGGSMIDPLDSTLVALELAGAHLVRYGAPADPGSMFWLAYREEMPIFNLASCSMFSRTTVADIVLPWIMTGEHVTSDTLASLGLGGLLDRDMTFRFPAYDVDQLPVEED